MYPEWLTPEIIRGFPVTWYSLLILLSILCIYLMLRWQLNRSSDTLSRDDTLTLLMWILVGALLFGRLAATLVYDASGKFLRAPWRIFWPFDGGKFVGIRGMSFYGGMVGVLVGGLLWAWRHNRGFLRYADMIAAGAPVAIFFSRIGSFINRELYGRITASPLGMIFPGARPVAVSDADASGVISRLGIIVGDGQLSVNLPRHPSQLYEAVVEGLILGVIMWFGIRPRAKFSGYSTAVFIILYSVMCFILEFLREPDPGLGLFTPLNLTITQIIAIAALLSAGIFLIVCYISYQRRPKFQVLH